MDYSYRGIERREEKLESSAPRIGRRVGVSLLRVFLFVFIAAFVVGCSFVYGAWKGIVDRAPSIDSISIAPSAFATFIYDSEGRELQKLTGSEANRTAVSLSRVPLSLQHAVIAAEDERFYLHKGVDPKSLIRALFTAASHGFRFTQGASTITQQLLKNNVFTTWTEEKTLLDSLERKLQEQYLALELEKKLGSKDVILENYLNTINLGAGTYGVQAAAAKYFGKDVSELTLSESTVIAGITQNPARFNPIRHPEENAGRRSRVLKKMLELHYITEEELEEALKDDVYSRIEAVQTAAGEGNTVYSYFVDALTAQVVRDLMNQKGYTEAQAYQLLYSGGLRIYSTEDRQIQAVCDEEYNNPENFPENTEYYLDWAFSVKRADGQTVNYSREMLLQYYKSTLPKEEAEEFDLLFDSEAEAIRSVEDFKSSILLEGDEILGERLELIPEPQSSMVIMDQRTGYVKAIVGGRGKKTASLTLNRATGSYRQPGSTFKILSTYSAALDSGAKMIGSYVEDAPFSYEGGAEVHNSTEEYMGWITLREAIVHSVNVAAVKTLTQITPARGYQQLLKFGITSLDPDRDVVQPLALGGISKGVSNLELTAGYAAIANSGIYTKPILYTRIYDQSGNIVIDNTPETRRAVSADTAFILTDAMEGVVKEGTATAVQLQGGMPAAGKTGTTSKYNDVWFVGYTPYYTAGVWAGYDNNKKLPEEGVYREYHKTLWKKVMDRLSHGQAVISFAKPDTVEKARICGLSNQEPSAACRHISEDYVSAAYLPSRICPICGSGQAETFGETDWKSYTDEVITGNNYEEIPVEEFENYLPEDVTDEEEYFPVETWDEGTYEGGEEWLDNPDVVPFEDEDYGGYLYEGDGGGYLYEGDGGFVYNGDDGNWDTY